MSAKAKMIQRRAREGQGHLAWIESHGELIAERLLAFEDTGISGVSYDRQRPAPGHSDPTARRALSPTFGAHEGWSKDFRRVLHDIEELRRRALSLYELPGDVVQGMLRTQRREAGAGQCKHCGRMCAGRVTLPDGSKMDDRLKGGRCDTCRISWERSGRTEERMIDCGHACCEQRTNPQHEHYREPEHCHDCSTIAAA